MQLYDAEWTLTFQECEPAGSFIARTAPGEREPVLAFRLDRVLPIERTFRIEVSALDRASPAGVTLSDTMIRWLVFQLAVRGSHLHLGASMTSLVIAIPATGYVWESPFPQR